MTSSPLQDDHTHLFRKSWTIYDAITERNYMFHREIYARVTELLEQRRREGPYHLLDLGCGNARFLAPCLQAAPPASYDGVDLAASALDEARAYLKGVPNAALHQRDLLEAVEDTDSAFDIIFTGFAVHHLDSDAKQRLFHACAQHLAPGGQFIMVDVVREDDQTREQYLKNYLHSMRAQWNSLASDQIEEACTHVATHDFPETLADLTRMAAAAGLRTTRLIDRHTQHYVLVFTH